MSEASEQAIVFRWAGYMQQKWPELRWMFHCPNGGSRNKIEAARLKSQGVRAGIPDILLLAPREGYHGLAIEMKFGRNKLTADQTECLSYLQSAGYQTAVCYSANDAIDTIEAYLG